MPHSGQEPAYGDPLGVPIGDPARQAAGLYNRIPILLAHATWFAFESQARLAEAVGVSRSTISRTISGKSRPSLRLAQAIAAVLSKDLGRPIGVSEVFSPDGTYPTRSGCALCGCPRGCFPDRAYDARGNLRPEFQTQQPGDWTLALAKSVAPAIPETPADTVDTMDTDSDGGSPTKAAG